MRDITKEIVKLSAEKFVCLFENDQIEIEIISNNNDVRKDLFKKAAYENERARVISSEIDKCDILLDIHSCSATSPAHALPGDNHDSISIASRFVFLLSIFIFNRVRCTLIKNNFIPQSL